jgi:acyl-CoA synthetase (NDP forming)
LPSSARRCRCSIRRPSPSWARPERAKWASQIFRNLREFGYPGKVYPVNPGVTQVWGGPCYADLASLPEPPQHATPSRP